MPRVSNVTFVCYEESTEEQSLKDFANAGNDLAFILHDKDVNPITGELKKPHYHVVCSLLTPSTLNAAAQRLVKSGIYPAGLVVKKIISKRKVSRYLLHLDDPEKAQYDLSQVAQLGWDVEQYCSDIDQNDMKKWRRFVRNMVIQEECEEIWQAFAMIEATSLIPEEYKDEMLGQSDMWLKSICDSIRWSKQKTKVETLSKDELEKEIAIERQKLENLEETLKRREESGL